MKEYKCHKTVKAAKIESIISNRKDFGRVPHPDREWRIEFTEQGDGECFVSQEWMEKHKPKCGGYVVVYEDGYMSFSPAQAFESGYTLVAPSHTFSRNAAIEYIARAIGEGYSPSQFAPSLLTYPHLVSLLSSSFLQEEYGRAWDWYNKGCNDLLDKGLVNAAPVVQVDGESFEMGGVKYEGNTLFDMPDALHHLGNGRRVCREGWNGKNMFVFMVSGNEWEFTCDVGGVDDLPLRPFLCMKTADNHLTPWTPSAADIFATDWMLLAD